VTHADPIVCERDAADSIPEAQAALSGAPSYERLFQTEGQLPDLTRH